MGGRDRGKDLSGLRRGRGKEDEVVERWRLVARKLPSGTVAADGRAGTKKNVKNINKQKKKKIQFDLIQTIAMLYV